MLSRLFYKMFILAYMAGIRVAAMVNPKAKSWLKGRRLFPKPGVKGPCIWMHCASLGEFEQGRPLLEAIKNQYPTHRIVLTFFSPSGYENCKHVKQADDIFYLPMDSSAHARKFLDLTQPSLVIWIKYEYWYYYLKAIKNRNIPLLLVSSVFKPNQPFFKWYGSLWREMLSYFTHIFVQNEDSMKLLLKYHPSLKVSLSGDTRFDRVSSIADNWTALPEISAFCEGRKVIVAGSTWQEDEVEWMQYANSHPEISFIFAPHLTDPVTITEVCSRFKDCITHSQYQITRDNSKHVLIIDNIGMLSRLYHYADITYVGGGFGSSGLHNILEAAVYGKPVIIGPEYEGFFEAHELIACKGGYSIKNAQELEALLTKLWQDSEFMTVAGQASADFIRTRRGATQMIVNYILENRLLTN